MSDELLTRLGFEPLEQALPDTGQAYNADFAPEPVAPEEQSLGDLWSRARDLDSTIAAIGRIKEDRAFPVDPNYKLDNYDELAKDIPPNYLGMFQEQMLDAKSKEHAISIHARFKHELEQSSAISSAGWKGLGVRFAANLFDEGGLALAVAGPAGWLAKGGRMARMSKLAVAAGVENAILEQVVKSGSQTRTSEDVMYALLGGLVLGGTLGGVIPGKAPRAGAAAELDAASTSRVLTTEAEAVESAVASTADVPRKAAEAIHALDEAAVAAIRGEQTTKPPASLETHTATNTEEVLESVGYTPRPERTPEELAAAKAVEAETKAAATETQAKTARVTELEAQMKELRQTVVDTPVRSTLPDEVAKVKKALADFKALAEDASAVARTRADQALQQAKRHFMRVLQTKHTDEFNASGLSANPKTPEFEAWLKSKGAKAIAKAEKQFAKDNEAYNAKLDELDEKLDALKAEHTTLTADKVEPPEPKTTPELDSAGAARTGASEEDLTRIDDDVLLKMEEETPDTAFANQRAGLYATINRSENTIMRWLGSVFMSDHVGAKDKSTVARPSASTRAQIFEESRLATYTAGMRAAYREWAKQNGYHLWQRGLKLRREFNRQVFRAVENPHLNDDPQVARGVKAWNQLAGDTIEYAQKSGLKGWDAIEHSDGYVPHIHNTEMWRRMSQDLEGETAPLQALVAGSMRSARPDLDEAIVAKVAKRYVDNIRRREAGIGGRFYDMSRLVDPIYARNLFEEIDLEEDDITYLLKMLSGSDKATQAGGVSRQKHRVPLDLDYGVQVRNKETGEEYTLKMRDMFEQDIDKLAHSYVRSIGGWAAIADATKGTAVHIDSPAKYEALIKEAGLLEASMGARVKTKAAAATRILSGKMGDAAGATLDSEAALLEMLKNSLTGVPINDPASWFTQATRRMKDYNFVTMMGQVIWAQTAELGSVIGTLGWKRTLQSIPEVARAFKRSKVDGMLDLELARIAETEIGIGTTALRGREHPMWVSDVDSLSDTHSTLDAGLHHLKNVVAAPMHFAMTMQQRLTSIGMLNNFGEFAMGRMKFNEGQLARMRQMGLGEADLKAISEQYQKHATWSNMRTHSGKLLNPNHEKWDNYDAWLKLKDAISRETKRIVQENDMSNVPPILSKNAASLAVQFRSFIIGAWEKHLLTNLHHRDMETAAQFFYTSMVAGLAYTGMTYTKAQGMDEKRKRKYLKERLSPEAVGAAVYSRAAWSSVMPTAVDTVLAAGGYDGVFSHTRGSGLQTSFVSGIPAVASVDRLMSAGKGLVAPVVNPDYDFSQRDWNALSGALPAGNLVGVYNVLNTLGASLNLPRSSKDD